jgi:hypothetical protein
MADSAFDLVGVIILCAHLFMMFFGATAQIFPQWFLVVFFCFTRISLAGVGHYHSHRKKDGVSNWGEALFDMQYVGTAIIGFDGHVMIHHM